MKEMEEEVDTTTLAKGTFWTGVGQVITKFFGFFYVVLLARFFSADEIGIFYFVYGVISMISLFTDFGLLQSLARYVPYLEGKGRRDLLYSLLKMVALIGGLASMVFSLAIFLSAGSIASFLGRPETTDSLRILAFVIFFNEMTGITGGYLVGRKKMKESQVISALQTPVKLILTLVIAFYFLGFSNLSISTGLLLSYIPIIIVCGYYMLRDIKSWKIKEAEQKEVIGLFKEVVVFGIIMMTITTLDVIAIASDRVMIGLLGGSKALESVGVYSIVTTFAGLFLLPFNAVLMIFFPIVSELFGKGKIEEMRKTTAVGMKWSILIAAPFFILLVSFPGFFLRAFYGEEYASGATVLILYTIALFVFSLSLLPLKTIGAMRRLDIELKIGAACALANIILNYFLILQYGMNGAAFATMLSFVLMGALTFWYSKRLFGFDFPKEIVKPIVLMAVCALLVFLSSGYVSNILSSIPLEDFEKALGFVDSALLGKAVKLAVFGLLFFVVCAFYFTVLILTKSFGKEEKDIIRRAMRRAKIPERYSSWILGRLG
jgi:O-antigen/teichoic acid export membrane protein